MRPMTRREAIAAAAAIGASLAWPGAFAAGKTPRRIERRDLFPQGVASGDPYPDSVLLWTRRPPSDHSRAAKLTVEVSRTRDFRHIAATATASLLPENDWTWRVLAAGLAPSREYWYRFTDDLGLGSRVGRTITAPSPRDRRRVHFAFVSCQDVPQGACNAYRRMIWEDERRRPADQLGFVLHLGDFVYEVMWYPEDRPQGMYDRRLRDIVRYADGEKIKDFHVPTTVDDYRALYRGYLLDPDLQDARARWPFVCVWDNHEFSWKGWQSQQNFGGVRPAQRRKVAANQAWFEYQPARVIKLGSAEIDRFVPPRVTDAPLRQLDDNGLGLEPSNIAAIGCLEIFRTLRYGRNVHLIVTDNRSYRSQPVVDLPEAAAFEPKDFPWFLSQDVMQALDAGRAFRGGNAPETLTFGGRKLPNFRKDANPQSMLGARQKAWFLERLRASDAPWKLWGNSVGMLDWRTDFQNLSTDDGPKWPATGFAQLGDDDWSAYRTERNEILDVAKDEGITGLVTLVGDRHSFLAGLLSTSLPPDRFEPVAAEFTTGSVSAPGLFEAAKYAIPKDHPLRAIYLYQPSSGGPPEDAINVSLMHGTGASMTLQRTGDVREALAARNPDVAPHLSWIDVGGHGYAVVRVDGKRLEVEFVCIPAPIERSDRADGGPLIYRVTHSVELWRPGAAPRMKRTAVEGKLPMGL